MRKAVFFDIDGTLVDCMKGMHDLSDEVKKAIKELQSQGNYAFVATGRPYAFIVQELIEFGFDGFILANGAEIIMNDKIVYESSFDSSFVKYLTEELDKRNIEYILEGEKYSYIKEEHKKMRDFYKRIEIPDKYFSADFDIDNLSVLKVETFCTDKSVEEACIDILNKNPGYSYFHSVDAATFEICHNEKTKASAILRLLEYLGIPKENSFAFGDGTNDIEMLSTVGCGVAMGNASEYVKSFAHEVTDTVYENGVSKGIYKYILK